ncbi:MAG: DUF6794 domain-containing protein [Methylobacter sp.]
MTKNWPDFFRQITRPPETVAEAIDWLMEILDDEDKASLAAMREENLINLHFGLGMEIRNAFRLHEPESKLLDSCGVTHPDDACEVIVKTLWSQLVRKKKMIALVATTEPQAI